MTNLRFCVIFFACLFSYLPAARAQVEVPALNQPDPGIFRYFVWGVSPEDVIQFETAKFYKRDENSVYFIELPPARNEFEQQFRRVIRYDFRDNKLWRANYEYQEFFLSDARKPLEVYEDQKRELAALYGEPVRDDYLWKSKTYYNYPEYWGRALASKQMRRETAWTLSDGSTVLLELYMVDPYMQFDYTVTAKISESEKPRTILDETPLDPKPSNPAPRP